VTRSSVFTLSFLLLWCAIATWESHHAFTACGAGEGWRIAYWLLHAVALGAPLLAWRHMASHGGMRGVDGAGVWLALLTYVPLSVAMRLVGLCTAAR
jgi:hypothetical protein